MLRSTGLTILEELSAALDSLSASGLWTMEYAMMWSGAAWSVWGKLDPASDSWMPLVRHLEDAAAVAGYLWMASCHPPRGVSSVRLSGWRMIRGVGWSLGLQGSTTSAR